MTDSPRRPEPGKPEPQAGVGRLAVVDRAKVEPDAEEMTRIVLRPIGSPLPLGFFTVAIDNVLVSTQRIDGMSTPDEVSSVGDRDGEIVALYLKWSGKVPGYPCGARLLAPAQERGRLTAELSRAPRRRVALRLESASSRYGGQLQNGAAGGVFQSPSTSPSGICRGPVTRTSPTATTSAPKVTSPSTSNRWQRRSDGAPPGNRWSKSGSSL
jgi:hypothetical protein